MNQNKISMKVGYVRTNGWRGYVQPVYAVAGANDTGTYSDSPCPSDVCEKELGDFCADLKKAGIKYRTTSCQTSNVFCIHRYVVVSPADHAKAYEIADNHVSGRRLFYKCEVLDEKKKETV